MTDVASTIIALPGGQPEKRSRIHVIGEQKGATPITDLNEIVSDELDEQNRAKIEMWISKSIGVTLMKTYPNRHWSVMADCTGRMVIIGCPSLSLTKGYYISMQGRTLHDLQIRAKQAAGEILERHRVTRDRNFTDYKMFDALPQTVRGDVITPDAAPEPAMKRVHV